MDPLLSSKSLEEISPHFRRHETLVAHNPLVLHRALLPLLILLGTLTFFPHRSAVRNMTILPPILAGYTQIILTNTSRHWGVAFCVGAYGFFGILQAFNYLVVKDVGRDPDFWTMVDGRKTNAKDVMRMGWYKRLRWNISLLCSSRGVGWGFQPKGIPTIEPMSIGSFIVRALGKMAMYYSVLDAYGYMISQDPYFSQPTCWSPTERFFSSSLPVGNCFPAAVQPYITQRPMLALVYQIARKSFTMMAINAILSQLYMTGALLFTCVGITPTDSWPDLFGPTKAAASLRGFWGSWWHQIFRLHFSHPGTYLAEKLKLDRKSVTAQTVKVLVAFACSGGLHYSGSWTLANVGRSTFVFFMLQPVGFAGELAIFKSVGKGSMGRWMVTCWTLCWLYWTCDVFFWDFLKGALGESEPVPLSLWKGLLGDGWRRWGKVSNWMSWDQSAFGWGIQV